MDARLIPLNAFIALVSPPGSSWPNPLHDAGYRLVALEVPLKTRQGGKVVADAVAFNSTSNRFLVVEAKSGQNVDIKQAQRYGRVDGRQLVQQTGVTVAQTCELAVTCLYVCFASKLKRILVGLERVGCAYPVLGIDDDQISLAGEPPTCEGLSQACRNPLSVSGPPPATIRVDLESEDRDFVRIVEPALIDLLTTATQGHNSIRVADLASRAVAHFHIYSAKYRNLLIKRVQKTAERLCARNPDYFRFRRSTAVRDYAIVELLDSPERSDPRGRTQRYQAIQRHFSHHQPGASVADEQQALFDESDLGLWSKLGSELDEDGGGAAHNDHATHNDHKVEGT